MALLFCAVVIGYADAPLLWLTAAVMIAAALIYALFGRRWQTL
jgi:hypothetical protein